MDRIIVAKFGGSSLADSAQFKKVRTIIRENPNRKFIVVSPPGKRYRGDHKITDLLYMCHQLSSHGINFDEVFQLIRERYVGICKELELNTPIEEILEEVYENILRKATRDYCASRGEYINGILLADFLDIPFVDAAEVIRFKAKGDYDEEITEKLLSERLSKLDAAVIPGFYGADKDGNIFTFSRGGSDITGSLVANAANAGLYENWTDVPGFLMVDPNIVENPKPIREITYEELRGLSYMGAPVLHEEAIFPVKKKGIPIQIRNTNKVEDEGTLIVHSRLSKTKHGKITGIAGKKGFTVLSIEKTFMTSEKGFLRKLVSVFESNDISIEHMPSSIDSISVIVAEEDIKGKLDKIIEEVRIFCKPDSITTYTNMALLAVVGSGMIRTKGISAKIFTALYESDINIRMISQGSSELSIIIGIENEDYEKSVAAIYNAFVDEV